MADGVNYHKKKNEQMKYKHYGKDKYIMLASLWSKLPKRDIAREIGVSLWSVDYLSRELRKHGYRLPRAKQERIVRIKPVVEAVRELKNMSALINHHD